QQLDLGVLAGLGVTVAGRLKGFSGTHALFADDLQATIEDAERRLRRALEHIDRYVERLPRRERPAPEQVPPLFLPDGPWALDLEQTGISTVIWATGYARSYPWLDVDVLGDDGEIEHRRGVTAVRGLYVLGLRFQYRRKSHFVGGVGDDARFLAGRILAPARTDRARRVATAAGRARG